jgi:hypothetical protein
MQTRCERRGQLEIGVIDHAGRSYAAFGSSVQGHNVTAYTRHQNEQITLTRWDGSTTLACRSEVVREFSDGDIALMFRLTHGRFIVGYALGGDGMLFRGELLTGCNAARARTEAWNSLSSGRESTPRTKPTPGTANQTRVTSPTGNGSRAGRFADRLALTPTIKL